MSASPTPSNAFVAAERVLEWHRQRACWRPIAHPLAAATEPDAPVEPPAAVHLPTRDQTRDGLRS